MNFLYIVLPILIVFGVIVGVLKTMAEKGEGPKEEKPKVPYHYKRKNWFMTRAEHEFYDALHAAVGNEYRIFAQVHLPTLLDHAIRGQDWRAALAHINRKSVDFVLCDPQYLSPKLAIELDDKSHEREDRKERDIEVERILMEAGMPLLRIQNNGQFNPSELAAKIAQTVVMKSGATIPS
jgi:very-short-patch-repair endonuclease